MSGRGRVSKAPVERGEVGVERNVVERDRAIDVAISQIERQFGKGSIMKMGDASSRMAIESIPTGSVTLDLALGVGGIPRGRTTEIYGPQTAGHTPICRHILADDQRIAV